MTGESSRVTRWAVLVALTGATALMYAISLRGNYLYGYGLGQTPEKRELFAWANVAADIWKGFGLVAVVLLWRQHKQMSIVAVLAWLVCLTTGVNSAIGVYVQDRTTLTGAREAKHLSYKEAAQELATVEERIKSTAVQRSVSQIEAAIAALMARPVMLNERVRGTVGSISSSCAKNDPRTAAACAEVAELRQELARARDSARLEGDAQKLRNQVHELREHGGAVVPDPVGEFWAWATHGFVSVRDVGFGFPLFFALLIEIVSAFGPAVIVAVAMATRREQADRQPAAAGLSTPLHATPVIQIGRVANWLADRTEPSSDSGAISIRELYGDYAAWCLSKDLQARGLDAFADEFDRVREAPQLAGKIRKFGERYYGIRLVTAGALLPPLQIEA